MNYSCSVFAVQDIKRTRLFYQELQHLQLAHDYGRNIAFEGGLAFQQDFDWLTGIDASTMKEKAHNCELCFETADFDDFVARLKARRDAPLLHDVMTHDWGQRVIRFYDPDSHIVEVGEQLKSVVERFLASGMTKEATAERMDVSLADVERILKS